MKACLSESLKRTLALALSSVRFAAGQLDRAGVAGCPVQLLVQRLRRIAEALELVGRFGR